MHCLVVTHPDNTALLRCLMMQLVCGWHAVVIWCINTRQSSGLYIANQVIDGLDESAHTSSSTQRWFIPSVPANMHQKFPKINFFERKTNFLKEQPVRLERRQ